MKDVLFIVGSESDTPTVEPGLQLLSEKGMTFDLKVLSAHRNLEELVAFLKEEEAGYRVVIAAAGLSAALPGVVASLVKLPVIGIPLVAGALSGIDALLSILQLPRGRARGDHGHRQAGRAERGPSRGADPQGAPGLGVGRNGNPCWRRDSYSRMPAATETLNESTWPADGMLTRKSHLSLHQPVHPRALAAHHDADLSAEVQQVASPSPRVGSVDPEPVLLQQVEGLGDIGHDGKRHVRARAGGDLADGLVFLRRPARRDDHEVDAELVRGAQDGAEVLGVGDPVQDEDQELVALQLLEACLRLVFWAEAGRSTTSSAPLCASEPQRPVSSPSPTSDTSTPRLLGAAP